MTEVELKTKVQQYKRIQAEISSLQNELEPIKAVLEEKAIEHGGELQVDCFRLKMVEAKKETVAIKAAKAEFGDRLNNFIKVSFYSYLKVL